MNKDYSKAREMHHLSKEVAVERLQGLLNVLEDIRGTHYGSLEFEEWRGDTRVAIRYIFGEDSTHLKEFEAINFSLRVAAYVNGMDVEGPKRRAYTSGLDKASALLLSSIKEIAEWWQDEQRAGISPSTSLADELIVGNQVFLIHGRDHGTRDTVSLFLKKLGLEPIILQEQPDESQTIIQKFERYADVGFALAILTPDDFGGLEDGESRPRARQNVVFEFGYFIGKLGRERVRALVKGEVEIPSDYSGVLNIELDESGGWQLKLARELKAAGFEIDADKLL